MNDCQDVPAFLKKCPPVPPQHTRQQQRAYSLWYAKVLRLLRQRTAAGYLAAASDKRRWFSTDKKERRILASIASTALPAQTKIAFQGGSGIASEHGRPGNLTHTYARLTAGGLTVPGPLFITLGGTSGRDIAPPI